MPPLEEAGLWQTALLWPKTDEDEYGNDVLGPPLEVPVTWVWKRSKATDAAGNIVQLDASVAVDREVPIGSRMWLGTEEEWYGGSGTGTGSVGADDEVCYVRTFNKAVDIRGLVARREVGLQRSGDRLPTVEG